MNAVLIQQIHPGTPGAAMLDITKDRHALYCVRYDMDYWPLYENATPSIPVEAGNWSRVELIRQALDEGYEFVFWLDADTLIYDMDVNLRDAVQENKIGVCWHRIPQLNHWNIGAMYIHNSYDTREFIVNWLKGYNENDRQWLEQGVFNKLALQGKTVVTISDKWNATLDVSMVPDAVVLGFHGQGGTDTRIRMMRAALDQIADKESASASLADGRGANKE